MAGLISLIGFMGTGKSAAGREASRMLGYAWYDLDTLIEEKAGMSIPAYMDMYGEEAFRDLESEVLCDTIRRTRQEGSGTVLSCGGGVILREQNRELLKNSGKVIRLTASPETILERVRGNTSDRPVLGTDDETALSERILSLMEDREELYRQTSHADVETDGLSPAESAALIVRASGGNPDR